MNVTTSTPAGRKLDRDIARGLQKLSLIFPLPNGLTGEDLTEARAVWRKILGDALTENEYRFIPAAFRLYARTEKQFPVPAQIIEAVKQISQQQSIAAAGDSR